MTIGYSYCLAGALEAAICRLGTGNLTGKSLSQYSAHVARAIRQRVRYQPADALKTVMAWNDAQESALPVLELLDNLLREEK